MGRIDTNVTTLCRHLINGSTQQRIINKFDVSTVFGESDNETKVYDTGEPAHGQGYGAPATLPLSEECNQSDKHRQKVHRPRMGDV